MENPQHQNPDEPTPHHTPPPLPHEPPHLPPPVPHATLSYSTPAQYLPPALRPVDPTRRKSFVLGMVTPWIICGLVWFLGAFNLRSLAAPAFYIGIGSAIIYTIVDIRRRGHAHYLLGNIAGFFMLTGCGLLALAAICGLGNQKFH